MSDTSEIEKIKEECRKESFYCFVTAYIFEKKAKGLKFLLRLLQFFGIIVPLSVGGLVVTFGTSYLTILLYVSGSLSLIQLILNVWAIVFRWEESLAYFLEGQSHNQRLSDSFKRLSDEYDNTPESKIKFSIIDTENKYRSDADAKQDVSEKEKREGHRAALRHFQKVCVTCKLIPESMKPSKCGTCGNF